MVALALGLLTGHVNITVGRNGAGAGRVPGPALPAEPVDLDGIRIGQQDASAVVILFSDFECPFCRQFATDTWPTLLDKYVRSGRLQVVFRNLPLTAIHPKAADLAAIATCAADQGAFEAAHDRIFVHSTRKTDTIRPSDLADLGLDQAALDACALSTGPARVERDRDLAGTLGISGTPTLLFGRLTTDGKARVLLRRDGAVSLNEIEAILARSLSVDP